MIRVLVVASLLLAARTVAFGEEDEWSRIQGMAKAHYDIIMLLIQGKEFDKVVPESRKMFSLRFPQEKENLLVKSTLNIADSLRHCERFDLAHRVIDDAVKTVKTDSMKASLYEEKAYTFEKEGKREDALDYFQKARELKGSPR